MKFRIFILLILFTSCTQNYSKLNTKKQFYSKGFAYIYNNEDFEKKIINKKFNENLFEIAHNKLRPGTLIKIINIKNNNSIILKNSKKLDYPDFYKILVTPTVAKDLKLNKEVPLVEVIEIKKNSTFIAKKQKFIKKKNKFLPPRQLKI